MIPWFRNPQWLFPQHSRLSCSRLQNCSTDFPRRASRLAKQASYFKALSAGTSGTTEQKCSHIIWPVQGSLPKVSNCAPHASPIPMHASAPCPPAPPTRVSSLPISGSQLYLDSRCPSLDSRRLLENGSLFSVFSDRGNKRTV